MNASVSIIIPCYNQANFLPETLDSVLAQTVKDWECIIIDDGSPDNTREIATKYSIKDRRVKLFSQENRGLAGARNKGIELSNSKYVQFLDSDDSILPNKLEKQLASLRELQQPAISFCDYYFSSAHDLNTRIHKGHDYEHPRLLNSNAIIDLIDRWETDLSIPAHSFLFDSRLFTETGIRFDESLPNHEDWDCWMRIFKCKPAITQIHEELAVYRQHPNSMITNKQKMWEGYKLAIEKQLGVFSKNPEVQLRLYAKLAQMQVLYLGTSKSLQKHLYEEIADGARPIAKHAVAAYKKFTPWPIQEFFNKFKKH